MQLIYGGRKKAVEFGDMKKMERLRKEKEKGQVLNKMDEESVRKTKIERVTEQASENPLRRCGDEIHMPRGVEIHRT